MLNELHGLSKTLSDTGISVKQWHREYLTLPKVRANAPCFRIWVDSNGEISGFSSVSEELAAGLRKYGNKHGTFPAFNAAPLYRLTDAAIISELDEFLKDPAKLNVDKVQSWLTEDNWLHIAGKIKLSIVGKATELKAKIGAAFPGEKNSMTALLEAMDNFAGDPVEAFRQALEKRVVAQLQSGEDVRAALFMLFHKGHPAKAPKDDRGSLSVILDYAGWQEYGSPAASEQLTEWVNDVLLKTDSAASSLSDTEGRNETLDAFGLPLGHFEDEPMPEVNMPGLAGVKLRSMFNQVYCQRRYGCFDGDSFPVSMKNRAEAKAALEYLSSPANKGVTWKMFGDKEIALAYPSRLDPRAVAIDWLAPVAPGADDSETRARFDLRANDFMRAFDALSPKHKPDAIRVFSLRKMDKARTKVVFTRNTTPGEYIECAEKWQKGCANIPEFRRVKPLTPFPVQVAALLNDAWKRDGELATTASSRLGRMQPYQGIELLFGAETEQNIAHYLRMLLQNCQGLFLFTGNTWHRNKETRPLVSGKLSMLLPLLGLFLYKGGLEKEIYMQSAGYLVGQLLKLSDELHAMYCQVVRQGDIPPQLVGNSVFITATETPVKALALLGQRLLPYLAWAKRYSCPKIEENKSVNNNVKLVGWYFWFYSELTGKLKESLAKDARFDEFEQAQVFLGYLAAFPKREKDSKSPAQNNTEEDQGNE